jgi:uncharacterized membrane protein YbhN (UPF0104 family)
VNLVIGAFRWRVLLSAYGAAAIPSFGRLVHAYYVGFFYNTYFPGGVGGDVVRGVLTRRAFGEAGATSSVAVVFVERILGLGGLLLLVAGSTLAAPRPGTEAVLPAAGLGLLAAGAVIGAIAGGRRLGGIAALPERIAGFLRGLPALERPVAFALALALSLVTHSFVALTGWCVLVGLHPDVGFLDAVIVVPLSMATAFLPVSVGGLGVREAAFERLATGLLGVSTPDAVAAALLIDLTQFLVAGAGGLLALLPAKDEGRVTDRLLGLPVGRRLPTLACAAAVFLAYLATMATGPTGYDSAELAMVAHQLGRGHPTGQPLHTLLAFPLTRLFGAMLGAALLSAVAGATSVVSVASLRHRLAPGLGEAGLVAIGLGAVQYLVWEPATRVEVYALAHALGLWALAKARDEGPAAPHALQAGLAVGLSASANPLLGVAYGLAVPSAAASRIDGRSALAGLGGAALGLLPYLYVPLIGLRTDVFLWGDDLGAYFRGADYAHNQTIDPSTFLEHVGVLLAWYGARGLLPTLLAGLLAWGVLSRGLARAALPIVFAIPLAFVSFNVVFHPDVPDYAGYLSGAQLLAAGALGAALDRGLARGGRFRIYALLGALALLPPLFAPHLRPARRSHPSPVAALVDLAAEEAPEGAVLVVASDHWVGGWLYGQEVDGRRPDLVLVPYGLASSGWYFEHLARRHPALAPFELRGPGGRDGRVRRLVAAQDAPVLVESLELALRVGRPVCAVGVLGVLAGPDGCPAEPDPSVATRRLAGMAPTWGEDLETLARVGVDRAELLWHLGRGRQAEAAARAGLRGAYGIDTPGEIAETVRPLPRPLPPWPRPAALADPARNLSVAAALRELGGDPEGGRRLRERAGP